MLVKSQLLNKLLLKSAYINYKPTIFPVENSKFSLVNWSGPGAGAVAFRRAVCRAHRGRKTLPAERAGRVGIRCLEHVMTMYHVIIH
jgi:hypothetical protein